MTKEKLTNFMSNMIIHYQLSFQTIKLSCTFLLSIFVMLTAGSMPAFSSFSESLRSKLLYTSTDLNLVSGMGNTALYVGILVAGFIQDKRGLKFTMSIATLTLGMGYFFMWGTYEQISWIPSESGWMGIYFFIIGIGSSASYMGSLAVNLTNFSSNRAGLVSGTLAAFYGLSGTIVANIYTNLFHAIDTSGFLLFLCISITIINGLGILLMWEIPYSTNNNVESKIVDLQSDITPLIKVKNPIKVNDDGLISMKKSEIDEIGMNEIASRRRSSIVTAKESQWNYNSKEDMISILKRNENAGGKLMKESKTWTIREIVKSKTFWLYTLACIFQGGITYFYNISSILTTILGPNADQFYINNLISLHVSILSIMNCLGRLLIGTGSDFIHSKYHFNRTILFFLAQCILAIPFLILGFSRVIISTSMLLICSILVGLAFGACGGIFPVLTLEYFGKESFGTACGLVMLGVPFGFVTENFIYGILYDELSASSSSLGSVRECFIRECYSYSFIVFFIFQCIAIIFSGFLYKYRTSRRQIF